MRTNPQESELIHVESQHPFHAKLYKTWDLLKIINTNIYFVVEGCSEWSQSWEELQISQKYYYEEHSCPVNVIKVYFIFCEGDKDPHGIFELIESVWMTQETSDIDFTKLFPQMEKEI